MSTSPSFHQLIPFRFTGGLEPIPACHWNVKNVFILLAKCF